jgi:hypothetical protein
VACAWSIDGALRALANDGLDDVAIPLDAMGAIHGAMAPSPDLGFP